MTKLSVCSKHVMRLLLVVLVMHDGMVGMSEPSTGDQMRACAGLEETDGKASCAASSSWAPRHLQCGAWSDRVESRAETGAIAECDIWARFAKVNLLLLFFPPRALCSCSFLVICQPVKKDLA